MEPVDLNGPFPQSSICSGGYAQMFTYHSILKVTATTESTKGCRTPWRGGLGFDDFVASRFSLGLKFTGQFAGL